ncbi:polygalacturonase At1g48100-like [Chenopodium quinoa]|uniref:polygalacturonase At1g48100-like n=1 Tax=Chenopodium quinoa TaxID=63459 RepID=UPI000B77BF19|nr:polygalacturonase At1g48100-like [Chenopodium quinoa]
MKCRQCLSILYLFFFLASFHVTFLGSLVEARKSSALSHKKHKHGKGKSGRYCPTPAAPTPPPGSTDPTMSNNFNVLSFGAKGNEATDDTKALLEAWEAACKVEGATVEIPSGNKFLINPITFQGPCMPQLVLQIDGVVLAPPKVSSWPKSGLFQWINFKWVQNFTIQGSGIVDGQGSEWWMSSQSTTNKKRHQPARVPSMKPSALRFYSSNGITVRDITITNSPLCHLKFDNSVGIQVHNVTISSPEDSPNTDGIHLQNCRDVEIHHSNIGCGDDCVSIQTGCSNVHLHHITCCPGHGISLGGLGKDRSIACVSDIVVEDIIMHNTLFGVRIKTWPGGIGSVKNVSFSGIQVSDVKVPLIIDQFYCESNVHCKNQTGAVAISGIQYNKIVGTYSTQPIHFACSNDIPCSDVDLIDIQLTPSPRNRGLLQALCLNSYGKTAAPLIPQSIDYCLRDGHRLARRVQSSHEKICQLGY